MSNRIVIDGAGAILLCHNVHSAIYCDTDARVTVQNFTILNLRKTDYRRILKFAQRLQKHTSPRPNKGKAGISIRRF